jgi:hypothetical protein
MVRFAYQFVFGGGRSAAMRRIFVALALAATAGCTAGTKPAVTGGAGSGGSGTGAGGRGGATTTGVAGSFSLAGQGGTIITNPDAGACQMKDYTFEPKIPTVVLLVDRSGSMFDCTSTSNAEPSCADINDTAWTKLKAGVLPIVEQLQHEVRFGFATITGSNPQYGGTCPILSPVAPALDNYAAIASVYNGLAPGPNSTQRGVKYETPTRMLLEMVGAQLAQDPSPGDKFVLFVTDGEPDYCGDENALCPPDGVVWQLQRLKQAGITTIVIGIRATFATDLPAGVLEAFANAGAGEPTRAPLRTGATMVTDFFDQCFNPDAEPYSAPKGWTTDLLSIPANAGCMADRNSCRGRTLGTYAATAGPTQPYRPDVTNQQALVAQLSAALSGVKSCVFDLTPVKVDRNQLAKASVLIEGVPVPLDPASANGWNMTTDIQLQLFGSACDTWRDPNKKNIQFNFPCEIIVD